MSYDTESEELVVEVNGEKLENVTSLYVYQTKEYDSDEMEVHCNISILEKGEGINKSVTYYTSSSEQAKAAISEGEVDKSIPGFVGKKTGVLDALFSISRFS